MYGPYTVEKANSRFSDHNAPYIVGERLSAGPSEGPSEGPSKPWPLVRQTNEWINYFGEFGVACAEINTERGFQTRIGRSGNFITRHVLQVPINSNILLLSPTNIEVGAVQREVRDKVEWIYMQLEVFEDVGLRWKKVNGGANLTYQGEDIFLRFILVEETSMFHVIISKRSRYLMGELTYPDMENVSSLIYCLRMIFVTPGLFNSFDFELNAEDIERASVVTFELGLAQPQEEPEWLHEN